MPVVLSIVGPRSYNEATTDAPISKELRVFRVEGDSEEIARLNEDLNENLEK